MNAGEWEEQRLTLEPRKDQHLEKDRNSHSPNYLPYMILSNCDEKKVTLQGRNLEDATLTK